MRQVFLLSLILFIFSACSVKYNNIKSNTKSDDLKIQKLSLMIQSLSKKIDTQEANNIAFEAIAYSKELANSYNIVSPALFHNSLINMGLKQRGYCYHFANDLLKHLEKKDYKSFYLKKVVSQRGQYFEHTSLIITNDDIEFKDSIVLDAWRDSGILFFSKIKNDKKYNWELK